MELDRTICERGGLELGGADLPTVLRLPQEILEHRAREE